MIKWVFYHCAISADQCCLSFLPSSFSHYKQKGLDSNPWPLDDQVGVLPLCYCRWQMLSIFLPSSLSHCKWNLWTQTFDLKMTGWVFYHCAITANKAVYLFAVFSLPMQVKSMNSNPWPSDNQVSDLPLCYCHQPMLSIFLPPSLTRCNQNCLDSCPWPSDDQVSVLPLCYCHLPMLSIFLPFYFSCCNQNCLDSNPWPVDDQVGVLPLCYCCLHMLSIFLPSSLSHCKWNL